MLVDVPFQRPQVAMEKPLLVGRAGFNLCLRSFNKLKTTPTPNKNGSYGIKGGGFVCHMFGSVCHIFCRNPLILTDFYATRTPIVWHILGAFVFANMGVGLVRMIFEVIPDLDTKLEGQQLQRRPTRAWRTTRLCRKASNNPQS